MSSPADTTISENGPAPVIAMYAVRDASESLAFDPFLGTFQSLETAARTEGGNYAKPLQPAVPNRSTPPPAAS